MWAIYATLGGLGTYVFQDVPVVKFMYLAFTHMPRESYRKKKTQEVFVVVRMCDVFRALINSLVC